MKRLVTYLFHYDNGNKCKNIGFVRTDVKADECRMEVHVQNLGHYQGKGKIYLLVKGEECAGICIGTIVVSKGRGEATICFSTKSIMESNYDFFEACGVGIWFVSKHYAASFWENMEDSTFYTGKFMIWEKEEAHKVQEDCEKKEILEEKKIEVGCLKTKEKRKEEQDQKQNDKCEKATLSVRKIDINGIRTLPKRNWYLCNNSFVVHGFFEYQHLIVKEMQEGEQRKLYLGVPGRFARQEKVLAFMFGFPEFEEKDKKEEPPKEGDFGYWLCLLEM